MDDAGTQDKNAETESRVLRESIPRGAVITAAGCQGGIHNANTR